MAKKVGIVTFHAAHNYGAVLQTYALQETVRELGHECFVVDYRPRFIENLRGDPRLRDVRSLKGLAKHLMYATYLRTARGRRRACIDRFINERMSLSGLYRTLEELRERPPEADAFICGSDQVWNPRITGADPAYLLDFAPDGRQRIAYAASFGRTELPADMGSLLREQLPHFSAISVRESSACEMVRRYANCEAQWVLDPTLLRTKEQWSEIGAAPVVEGPYILCYLVREIPAVMKIAKYWQKETGYPIVLVGGRARLRRRRRGMICVCDAGPREYLALFQYASLVIAMSFHGTAFAVAYRKPFCSIMHPTQRDLNFRVTSLLELLKMSSRLYDPDKSEGLPSLEVNYDEVEPILDRSRRESVRFLADTLSG